MIPRVALKVLAVAAPSGLTLGGAFAKTKIAFAAVVAALSGLKPGQ